MNGLIDVTAQNALFNPLQTRHLKTNVAAYGQSFHLKWPFLHLLTLFLVFHVLLILNTSNKKNTLKNDVSTCCLSLEINHLFLA